jgi:hypothetical protein
MGPGRWQQQHQQQHARGAEGGAAASAQAARRRLQPLNPISVACAPGNPASSAAAPSPTAATAPPARRCRASDSLVPRARARGRAAGAHLGAGLGDCVQLELQDPEVLQDHAGLSNDELLQVVRIEGGPVPDLVQAPEQGVGAQEEERGRLAQDLAGLLVRQLELFGQDAEAMVEVLDGVVEQLRVLLERNERSVGVEDRREAADAGAELGEEGGRGVEVADDGARQGAVEDVIEVVCKAHEGAGVGEGEDGRGVRGEEDAVEVVVARGQAVEDVEGADEGLGGDGRELGVVVDELVEVLVVLGVEE